MDIIDQYQDGEYLVTEFSNGAIERRLPTAPVIAPAVTILTKLEYMNRFTDSELAAIYTAAKQSIEIEIWLEKFKLATEIDLSDPRTIAGVQALEAVGLIGASRADEILA